MKNRKISRTAKYRQHVRQKTGYAKERLIAAIKFLLRRVRREKSEAKFESDYMKLLRRIEARERAKADFNHEDFFVVDLDDDENWIYRHYTKLKEEAVGDGLGWHDEADLKADKKNLHQRIRDRERERENLNDEDFFVTYENENGNLIVRHYREVKNEVLNLNSND